MGLLSSQFLKIATLAGLVASTVLASTSPRPVVEIPKASYAHGEQVFFWVGVEADSPMERESYQPCTWTIVNPHGESQSHSLGWPMDGDGRHGWRGGAGVAAEDTVPGVYSVTVSCGASMVEASFEVHEFSPLQQIEASLKASESCDGRPKDQTLRLTVKNASQQQVVVSVPGSLDEVSFSATTRNPQSSCAGFFPPEATGVAAPQPGDPFFSELAPDDVDEIPHIVLAPGESHTWSFCLSSGLEYSSCPFEHPPNQVRVYVPLQVLFRGSPPQAPAGPYRLPVEAGFSFKG